MSNSFATAITDGNGHFLGVICNRAAVRWSEREFQNANQMFRSGGFPDARLELVDEKGATLVRPLPLGSESEQPEHGPTINQDPAELPSSSETHFVKIAGSQDLMVGSSRIIESKFVESLGWSIRITAGASVSRKLSGTLQISYGLILTAAVCSLVLALAYTRRLSISRFQQELVALRTNELRTAAKNLERRNEELERSQVILMETNDQLNKAQKELTETAKRLGQTEVAALTLHNIGNIVTSLNIQSTLLREHADSEIPDQLSRRYLKNLLSIFGKSEPIVCRIIAGHIQRIDEVEEKSCKIMRDSIRIIIDNVRMAMSAISSQTSFVNRPEVVEECRLMTMLQDIILVYNGTFKRHQVEVRIEVQIDVLFFTERFRFDSILTVLIRNAIDATEGIDRHQIVFSTTLDEHNLILTIRENGSGFSKETAEKLFQFEFTTKENGHGFVLHYAANSCKYLGMQLKLESPGKNQGATASILIPRENISLIKELESA